MLINLLFPHNYEITSPINLFCNILANNFAATGEGDWIVSTDIPCCWTLYVFPLP